MKKENMGAAVGTLVAILVLVGIILFARMGFNSRQQVNMQGENKTDEMNSGVIKNTNDTNTKSTNMKTVAQVGDQVTVNYTGMLQDGTVFDSNVDPKFGHVQPFTFQLGVGMVIKGWDEGVLGMKVGEKKHLVIPAEKAYGDRAIGAIPANSTLEFDVEVLSIN